MTSLLKGLTLGLSLAAFGAHVQADDHEPDVFSYMDLFDLEYATGMAVHPDGKTIVYERRSMDVMLDRQRSNLWRVNTDGSGHRPLLSGTDSYRQPRFSPSGDRIAYVTAADRGAQIYVRWMDGSDTVRVTNLEKGPGNITWSPDGKWIAFTMSVDAKHKPMFRGPTPPKGAKWAGQSRVIHDSIYKRDGLGFLPEAHSQIFVVPAEGGTPRQLTDGHFNHGSSLSWTRDSSALLFSANRNEDWQLDVRESDVWHVLVADGTLTQLTAHDGVEFGPSVHADGKRVFYRGYREDGLSSPQTDVWLGELSADGLSEVNLTEDLDRSVAGAEWAPDGRSILISYDSEGKKRLARLSLDGKVTELTDAVGGTTLGRPYTSGAFTVAGRGAVITLASPEKPADLAYVDRRGNVTPITDLNSDALGHKTMSGAQRLVVKSSYDDREIEGWLSLPPGKTSAEGLPLILEIHGGPHTAYGPAFSPEVQLYAAAGYAVLYTNPRGSTSYGKEFANTIHQNYPSQDYDDLMDMVNLVVEMGVDENRLFVTGGSGGGVLSAWIIGKTDRFKAAVVAKPVINWISFVGTPDIANFVRKYWFGKDIWEDISDHWARSPLRLVGNVETPTMLLTGAEDLRTPMSETEQYYQALSQRGVETVMVQVPKAFHGIAARPSNLIQKVGHVLAWFEKYDPSADAE